MYNYAIISYNTKIVESFETSNSLLPSEEFPDYILVDEIDETWIRRKKWDATTQTWLDVTLSETKTNNSLEFTHIDSNGTKHWLDVFVNNLAVNTGGSVETATVTEVEAYLGI